MYRHCLLGVVALLAMVYLCRATISIPILTTNPLRAHFPLSAPVYVVRTPNYNNPTNYYPIYTRPASGSYPVVPSYPNYPNYVWTYPQTPDVYRPSTPNIPATPESPGEENDLKKQVEVLF